MVWSCTAFPVAHRHLRHHCHGHHIVLTLPHQTIRCGVLSREEWLRITTTTKQRIVWCGKVRNTWWPWHWCRRCRWAMANPAAWKMFVQNIAHRNSKVCGCPIVLQPHVIQEYSVSQLRYESRLQHCRIRCRVHRSIKKVRSNQIIWCHTRPYDHMRWIIFQLLREMGILLWPEHHISVTRTAIDGTFVTEKNLWAGYGTWERVQQSTAWFIAPIHVAIWQFILESWAIRPHIQVFLHVVSHCSP